MEINRQILKCISRYDIIKYFISKHRYKKEQGVKDSVRIFTLLNKWRVILFTEERDERGRTGFFIWEHLGHTVLKRSKATMGCFLWAVECTT